MNQIVVDRQIVTEGLRACSSSTEFYEPPALNEAGASRAESSAAAVRISGSDSGELVTGVQTGLMLLKIIWIRLQEIRVLQV